MKTVLTYLAEMAVIAALFFAPYVALTYLYYALTGNMMEF